MKVSELVLKTHDRIILYKENGEEYVDIFKGFSKEMPNDMLQMNVRVYGAKRKGILDIQVI